MIDIDSELQAFQRASGRFAECRSTPEMVRVFSELLKRSSIDSNVAYLKLIDFVCRESYWLGLVYLFSSLISKGYDVEAAKKSFSLSRQGLRGANPEAYIHFLGVFSSIGDGVSKDELRSIARGGELMQYSEVAQRCLDSYCK